MSKVETACPHCRKWNTVEKSSASVTTHGYKIQWRSCTGLTHLSGLSRPD